MSNKPLVILKGIVNGNIFYSTNTPGSDPTKSSTGDVYYQILDYADTDQEAQDKIKKFKIMHTNLCDEIIK